MNPEKPKWDPGAIYRSYPLAPLPILPPYLPWLINPHVKDANSHPHPLPAPRHIRPPAPLCLRRNRNPAAPVAKHQDQAK